MKIKQLLFIGLIGLLARLASAQLPAANANFAFTLPGTLTLTTSGTYQQTDNFSFSIRLNYPGPAPANIQSLSYWFEVPTSLAPFITITSQSINDGSTGNPSLFSQNLAPSSDFPMSFATAADAGKLRDDAPASGGDLGGTAATAISPNSSSTYYISTLSFNLANAPVGSYILQTTSNPPTSVSNSNGDAFTLPTAQYTINVVPEPATLVLVLFGIVGALGLNLRRNSERED
jgi:hypothetical protein